MEGLAPATIYRIKCHIVFKKEKRSGNYLALGCKVRPNNTITPLASRESFILTKLPVMKNELFKTCLLNDQSLSLSEQVVRNGVN